MKLKNINTKIAAVLLALSLSGCEKFVEVRDPIDQIPTDVVFETDAKAASAVRGMYGLLQGSTSILNTTYAHSGGIQISASFSADELMPSVSTNTFNDFYLNRIPANNGTIDGNIWGALYNVTFTANSIIQGLEQSTGVSAAGKARLSAEARFVRAANYFYLVNFFGGVPLAVTTDYRVNAVLPRSTPEQVYSLIVSDLKFAVDNLAPAYIGTQRLRANKYAAAALLARVYLYLQDWQNAEMLATQVIDAGKTVYDIEPDLNKAFLTSSKEVILQLQQPGSNLYTWDGFNFNSTNVPQYQITEKLFNAFEAGDLRKVNWIRTHPVTSGGVTTTYYNPYKYKLNSGTGTTRTESMVFLRLSEIYLIRAEARVKLANLSGAIEDLDVVRNRAKIALIKTTQPNAGAAELLALIEHERFVELFAEGAHRWFDLKRTGRADVVLAGKPNWRPEAKLYPIPNGDITRNVALEQNPGYN